MLYIPIEKCGALRYAYFVSALSVTNKVQDFHQRRPVIFILFFYFRNPFYISHMTSLHPLYDCIPWSD